MSDSLVKAKKRTILVIDDEEDIRTILERRLYREGFDVETAANGKHAIQKIQTGKKFDLIICDLKMPMINGSSLIIELRKARFSAPIVVLTGHPDRSWLTAAAPWGIDAIFLKPFKAHEFLGKINELFSKAALTAEESEKVAA